jgi:transglutaminase-like putative cysteine protease
MLVGVLLAVLITPAVNGADRSDGSNGEPPPDGTDASGSSMLRSSPSLDMTTRPRLSDRVVMTVRADRPAFWRGQTYDAWDGATWTNTDAVQRVPFAPSIGSAVPSDPYDIGARTGDRLTQRVTIEAASTDLLFAAASPVEIRRDGVTYAHPDGTLTGGPLGKGASYTVVSRRLPVTEDDLRAADGPAPAGLLDRYAQPPTTTARVRSAARAVTADAHTTYDRVVALERWMGRRTEYSLDAPLSPDGVDVVDHFLFEARTGWCEQIASALVVLLRSVGVPARLVTGYVPGEANPLWSSFTVRERDAHAWAEVWFPGIGWQAFDPTADVPLAGAAPEISPTGWLRGHGGLVLALLAFVALTGAVVVAVRSGRARQLHHCRSAPWVARASHRLDRLGRRARPRRPAETATAYGAVLAAEVGDDRLSRIGRILDEGTFGAVPTAEDDRAFVDRALHEAGRDLRRRRRSRWFDHVRRLVGAPLRTGA